MAIRFAFSTLACPDWSIDKVAQQAKEMGYDGVELRTLGAGGTQLASDPATTDPAKVRAAFDAAGVEPICLSASTTFDARDPGQGKAAYFDAVRQLELAAEIGCKQVRFFGLKINPGENRLSVIQRIASRIPAVAEKAMEMGIKVLLENAGSFNAAKEWWWLLNLVNHPNVGMCWNIANAASVDSFERGGGMAITMLNSKISLLKVKDTTFGEGSGFCQLGDGDVDVEQCLRKIRGIGFDGYITIEWDRAWLPALAPAEEYLPEALTRMKAWMAAIDEWVDKGRKAAEKAAKKNAPKPRAQVAAK